MNTLVAAHLRPVASQTFDEDSYYRDHAFPLPSGSALLVWMVSIAALALSTLAYLPLLTA